MPKNQQTSTLTILKRVFKRTREHIIATKWLSLATVVVIMLSLSVSGIIGLITLGIRSSVKEFASRPRIYVYFYPATEEQDILNIQDSIQQQENVSLVEYESQEDALENLKKKLGTDSDVKIQNMATLLPPRLNIKPISLKVTEDVVKEISEKLNGNPFVDEIRYSDQAIQNLQAISQILTGNSIALISISVISTILMVYVTINFAIKYYQPELEIMDFLGSKPFLLKTPFIIEALMYGLVGGLFSGVNLTLFERGNFYIILNNQNLSSFINSNNLGSTVQTFNWNETLNILLRNIALMSFIGMILCLVAGLIAILGNIKKVKRAR
jgi:cell division transport system permease protein